MIVVSGTGRSGTSMWMQALGAAGFPVIGAAFPPGWRERIGEVNPRGFFESNLINGINFTTNPDPATGARVTVEESRSAVVKVFSPGLRRTDLAWLGRVVVSVRGWRAFSRSVGRLVTAADPEGRAPPGGSPPEHYWFGEHLAILRDVLQRRYPVRFVAYDDVLADPAGTIGGVLGWIGQDADADAAVRAIEPSLRTRPDDDAVVPGSEPLDALYDALTGRRALDSALIRRLEEAHRALVPAR